MKKRKISLPFSLGVCLILCGLCLLLVSQLRTHIGLRNSREILLRLSEILPEKTPGVPGVYFSSGMPVLEIGGIDYAAVLEVPAFGVAVPVADQWDSGRLSLSPARFSGSVYDQTLIIGGADLAWQLAFCDKIEHGTVIIVTDMTGTQFTYTVSGIYRARHAEAQWLMDADCDLTLFCHDRYSMEYIAVRCTFAYL